MNNIIDGKAIAGKIQADLTIEIAKLGFKPGLAIVLVGNNQASEIYVRNKIKAASAVGIDAHKVYFPENTSQEELLEAVQQLNNSLNINGIIIQLPLPKHIDKQLILSSIDPSKDVDGFHPLNAGLLYSGSKEAFVPCTAIGCLELIKSCENNLAGKNAVIIGRSNIVGRPVAELLLQENCTVTICHSHTKNLKDFTIKADITIAAMGQAEFLTVDFFPPQAIVIDVGINKKHGSNKIVGDVDFASVKDKVKFITPVPGGVGPMTVTFLLANTLKAALKQRQYL